jgi:nucleotide-binding universal stress UspA family protein
MAGIDQVCTTSRDAPCTAASPAAHATADIDAADPSVPTTIRDTFAITAPPPTTYARAGATLEVVHTWSIPAIGDPVSMMPIQLPLDVMEREAQTVCDAGVAAARAAGAVSVSGTVHRGSAAEHLVAASKSADLVVVGSRGRGGFVGLLLGSVAQQVASHTACPVVVVPSR